MATSSEKAAALDSGAPDLLPTGTEHKEVKQEQDYVLIYHAKCLHCLHLIPTLPKGEGKAYKDCHFKTGNEDCPAAKIRIAVGVNMEKTARILFKSFKAGDTDKMQRISKRLSTKDPVITGKILAMVQQMIKES